MEFSISLLATEAQCDAFKAELQKEKEAAEGKLATFRASINHHGDVTTEVSAELVSETAMLSAVNSTLSGLSAGTKSYERMVKERERLEYRLKVLNDRNTKYSTESLLLKQLEYKRLENDIPLYDDLMAQVDTRKAEIAAG